MSRLVRATLLIVAGLVALSVAAPAITALIRALVPLVLVVGIVAAVLQLVRYLTRE
jgi:hypothetical protein